MATTARWTVVLPVKGLSSAKMRIDPERGGAGGRLALAFFRDTATAVLATEAVAAVLVATADRDITQAALDLGCSVIDDTGQAGINAAARWAVAQARVTGPIAVAVSDLPCLTPHALTTVLDAAESLATACFVADADGTGTTMWLDPRGGPPDSRFGPASANAHRGAGAVDIVAAATDPQGLVRARRDVDTESDLAAATVLGVGAATSAVLDDRDLPWVMLTALGRTHAGDLALVDEDGRRRTISWQSVTAAGFLEVRPGQRLLADPRDAIRLP